MFILRRVSEEGVEMNQEIGSSYTFIHREYNPEEFRKTFELVYSKNHVSDGDESADDDTKKCYAFVCNGDFVQPLYKNQSNYIMSSNGNTFSNVSYR